MVGGDGEPAVVRDAHLDSGASVVAEQSRSRGAVGARKHLDPPAGKADASAVEALDHRLLGRPPAGESFGVACAVGLLGTRVDLVKEAGAGAPDGEGYAFYRDGVDSDSLHEHHCALVPARVPPPGRALRARPSSPAS